MKRFISLLVCTCCTIYCFAQTPASPFTARNTVYFEGFGSAGLYSVNYERLVKTNPKSAVGLRVGGSVFSLKNPSYSFVGEISGIFFKGMHHLDLGLGLTTVRTSGTRFESLGVIMDDYWSVYAMPRVSYRYQKPAGGLMLRAGINPLLNILSNQNANGISFWPCLAIGHSF